MRLAVPPAFAFLRTVLSHGWFDLPPFHWDETSRRLTRVLTVSPGRHLVAELREAEGGAIAVRLGIPVAEGGAGAPRAPERREALRQVRHMLRLDEDYAPFEAACRGADGYAWIAEAGGGRLLRAPDPFEDLVKLIATTNCTWALTRVIVGALVGRLGEPVAGGGRGPALRSFPTPEAMAARPVRFFQTAVKAGYRAAYLKELAAKVADGRVVPSRWLDPERPSEEIRSEILALKGAGRYVADNMMKLLGRYDGLGIDSWCRRKFSEMHRRGRPVSDAAIARHYARFGAYRGLALWCDITRDWFEGDAPAPLKLREQKY